MGGDKNGWKSQGGPDFFSTGILFFCLFLFAVQSAKFECGSYYRSSTGWLMDHLVKNHAFALRTACVVTKFGTVVRCGFFNEDRVSLFLRLKALRYEASSGNKLNLTLLLT